jgi:hypothetical protein
MSVRAASKEKHLHPGTEAAVAKNLYAGIDILAPVPQQGLFV